MLLCKKGIWGSQIVLNYTFFVLNCQYKRSIILFKGMVILLIIALLFGVTHAMSVLSSVLNKKFQLGIKNNLPTMIMYNLINALFGTLCFFAFCKFRVEMNLITFIFSVVYALMVINSLAIGVISLSKMSIPFSAIISMAGSVTGATLFGATIFGEPVTIKQIVAMLMLIAAVMVTAFSSPELKHKSNSVSVCIWYFLTSFFTSPFIKIYMVTPGVKEINNMFFMTNLLAAIIAAIYIAIFMAVKGKLLATASFGSAVRKGAIINIGARTAISNTNSVLGAIIISGMDLTLYNILSSSLGLILNGCVSRFIFKENLTWQNYLSILFAVIAIIVRTI